MAPVSADADDNRVVMTIDDQPVSVDEFRYLYLKNLDNGSERTEPREYARMFAEFRMKVLEAEQAGIDRTPEFKAELQYYCSTIDSHDEMLRKEYRDGMLLFEISNRRVWSRAAADTEKLNQHFSAFRERFTWDAPHAKGWIVYCNDEEILQAAHDFLCGCDSLADDIRRPLRENFGNDVVAARFLTVEGANQAVDALVFSDNPPRVWNNTMVFAQRIIAQPEEWTDVKGAVTADYQQLLDSEWQQELWSSHKVDFNYELIDEIGTL